MKLLKQILIFLAFTGAIFGIFTIATRQKPELNTDALAAANHEQIIKEIDSDWSNLSDWDEETYNRQLTKVAQSLNAGVINDVDNRTLRDRINKSAYTKCVDAMEREFGRADCDDAKLTINYDGLQIVQMNEPGLSSNDRIMEVSKIYNLYKRVIAFNNRSFNMSPAFSGSTGSWNSWTDHQDRIFRQLDDLLSDSRFARIKGINNVKKIYDTSRKVADSRTQFYNRLQSDACAYFNNEISQYRQQAMNAEDDDPALHNRKSELLDRVSNVRIKLANNERYLPGNHTINARMRDITKEISSL
ncbi:MAG: hypothetical protein HDS77_05435 [Bacteroidales bacterium]|nr:hypothetical protein [Bacteroidales bacterium]MBD5257910.1 hypothetical protein [Barnesiella sp.]